jgi:hypothetical protein
MFGERPVDGAASSPEVGPCRMRAGSAVSGTGLRQSSVVYSDRGTGVPKNSRIID